MIYCYIAILTNEKIWNIVSQCNCLYMRRILCHCSGEVHGLGSKKNLPKHDCGHEPSHQLQHLPFACLLVELGSQLHPWLAWNSFVDQADLELTESCCLCRECWDSLSLACIPGWWGSKLRSLWVSCIQLSYTPTLSTSILLRRLMTIWETVWHSDKSRRLA